MNQNEPTLDHSKIAEALGSHPRELTAAEMNKLHAKGNVASVGNNLSPTESILGELRQLIEHQRRDKFALTDGSERDFRAVCRHADFTSIASHIAALEEQVRFMSNVRTELMEERDEWKAKHDEMAALNNLLRVNAVRECLAWKDAMHATATANCEATIAAKDAEIAAIRHMECEIDRLRAIVDAAHPAIIECPWNASSNNPCVIDGFWAEDGSRYEITVPSQIRNLIVKMQNALYLAYSTREAAEAAAKGSAK